jgi:AcrR family transcriptional regulator
VPTGVHIRDARQQLFDAAERILRQAGPDALTSRAVTVEAGCAKGVLHRYFADFDAFLAELVQDRIAGIEVRTAALRRSAGTGTIAGNLTGVLLDLFDPVGVSIVALVLFRDDLRARLRLLSPRGIPLLAEATTMISVYLGDEWELGRIAADTDIDSLALTVIGTGHLLFANRDEPTPNADAVQQVVAAVIADAVQHRLL